MGFSISYTTYNLINRLLVCYSSHDLDNKPFNDPTGLDHTNTKLVFYLNPHCVCFFYFQIGGVLAIINAFLMEGIHREIYKYRHGKVPPQKTGLFDFSFFGRSMQEPSSPLLSELASNVYKGIEKYTK